jgi:ligand-binding sensor domain-containing protein
MKHICSLLSVLFLISSCADQTKTGLPKDTAFAPPTTRALMPVKNPPDGDPTFVKSEDTVSTFGPGNITRNLLQDRNGNIWLASWEGIIRYEPASGKFTNLTLKERLRQFHVMSLTEDRAGNLWFGTIGAGAYRYDPVKAEFRNFTTTEGLAGNSVLSIAEDKNTNIWFGTTEGVSRFDPASGNFTNFTKPDGINLESVNSIIQDKTGTIWFGTWGGVITYDGKFFTNFTNKEGLLFANVRSIVEDKKGNIWIASSAGLCCYDPFPGTNFMLTKQAGMTYITTKFTGNLFEDKKGNIWLSESDDTNMALSRYDPASGKLGKIRTGDRQVFGIIEDTSGKIWFGTETGVYCYDPASGGFTDFRESSLKK